MRATIQPAPFASSALPWAWLIPDGTLFVGEVLCVDPTTDCEAPASLLPMATTTKDITQPLEVTVDFTHVLETGDTLVAADVELVQSEKQSAPLDLVAQVISDAKTRLFLLLEGGEPFSDVWLNVLGYAKTGAAYSGRFRIRPFDVTQIRAFSHA